MNIIVIANQKGGVGKTTTAVALAHRFALDEYTTVLIDLDSQGNAAPCLGLSPQPGLIKLMSGFANWQEVLTEARENLWFLPSDVRTAELKLTLVSKRYREMVLSALLDKLPSADVVVIDTGPGRDIMHENAHHAADKVIIPVAVDHLALIGVAQEFETLQEIREHGHSIKVTAVLPTFYDRVTNESYNNLALLADRFGTLVMPAVPKTVRLREAPAYGKTVWEYLGEKHEARIAYERLYERVRYD